jgi:hypothetical protein
MDQAVLVKSDRIVEAQVMEALSRIRIPVTLCDWHYVPQLEEWQLIIATPWYDSKGPQTTYRALVDALQMAGIYERVPMRRVFIRSPSDPLVKAIESEMKDRKEGFVHILKHMGQGNGMQYSLMFAPVTGTGGGAVPARRFSTIEDLRQFLEEDLHLRSNSIDEALDEVKRGGAGSIYPVALSTRLVKKLGLR